MEIEKPKKAASDWKKEIKEFEPQMEKQARDILGRGIQYGWAPIAVGLKYADKPRAVGAATVNKVITGGKSSWREDFGRNMSYGEIADKALAKTDLSPKAKRWLGAGIGFVADMLLDPLMWVTGGGSKVKDVTKAAKAFDALKDAYGAEKAVKLIDKTEDAAKLAKSLGVSDDLVKLAAKSKGVGMADSLADKAKAGQWAVAHIGRATTPKGFNTKVGGALDKAYDKWINLPVVSRMVHTTGNPELDRALAKAKVTNTQNNRLIKQYAAQNMEDIAAIEKATGKKVTTSELEKHGVDWLNGKGSKEQYNLAKRMFDIDSAQIEEYNRLSTGKPIKSLTDKSYFSMNHTLDNDGWVDAKRAVLRSGDGAMPIDKSTHSFMRKYVDIKNPATGEWEIGNIYEKAQQYGVSPKELEIRQAPVERLNKYFADRFKIYPVFSEDAAGAAKARNINMENANDVARKMAAYVDFTHNHPAPVDWAKKGWRKPEIEASIEKALDEEGKLKPMLSGYITELSRTPMNNAMAAQLEALTRGLKNKNPQSVPGRIASMYNTLWKDFTLPLRFRYHSRNWMSDPLNVAMAHGYDEAVKTVGKLPEAYKVLGKKEGVFHSPLYGDISYADLADKLHDYGIESNTLSNSYNKAVTQLENNLAGEATGGGLLDKIWRGVDKFDEAAQKVGKVMSFNGEDARRVANGLRALAQGKSFRQAADYVNKGMFDYATTTPLGELVGKGIPFYKFPLNNMKLQARTLAEHPTRLQALARGKYAVESALNEDPVIPEEKRPSHLRGDMSVQIGKAENGDPNFIKLANFIGPADAFDYTATNQKGNRWEEMATSGVNSVVSSLYPIYGGAVKLLFNRDFFRDKPIDKMQGAAENLSDYLLGVDRTNFMGKDVGAKVPTLVGMLPMGVGLQGLDRLNPFNVFGKERPDHKELTTGQKIASYVPGIRTYPVDMDQELNWREYDAQKVLDNFYNAEKPDEARIQRLENRLDQMYNLDDLILRYYGH